MKENENKVTIYCCCICCGDYRLGGFFSGCRSGGAGHVRCRSQALIDAAETLGVEFDPETLTVPVEGFEEGVSEGPTPRASIVKVPSNYIYNPSRGSLHDYCTKSPDGFPNPFGKNAPFHGPCAIHDMCIERAGYHNRACDAPLKNNMKANCRATYGAGSVRTSCEATANVYYAAVTAASYF